MSLWLVSHIFRKKPDIHPPLTNLDTPASIQAKVFIFRVGTAPNHAFPDLDARVVTHAMCPTDWRLAFTA
jgi:hypothetical protein